MSDQQRTEMFIGMFTKSEPRIFAFVLTLLPHWSDAEDVLQETNLVLWRKFDEFQPGTDFVKWACRIAYLEVLAFRKRNTRRELEFGDDFLEAVAQEVESHSGLLDARHRALAGCLKKLNVRDRDLILRRYSPGGTTQSVSQQVGRSIDACYKALNRIRQALLDCIHRTLSAQAHP